ncbi:MAG TPA: response regulator [Leptolyngbyaceae cyanobacterium M33_DOE_097]|uniref:histidine kinase n=1 Tax=Oscillatoriales cyanobacterium SpSt-418 TaxID=2282169 RepID=A0A7C3PU10_9CYAN|nr:response regulator [Leptolyngbyaceae cyanobacterium M33_DOE_097]
MANPLQVLVIDDNRSDRALVIRELRREFSHLTVQEIVDAKDFEQAIAKGNFDVVVTDYQLGWSDGLKILRTVKAHYPRCPVIMFTNTGTEEIAVEALKSGLDDYVLKQPNRYIRVPIAVRVALERLEMHQRAALLEIRLQGLLNQVKIGIFRSNSDGTLLEANPAFLDLLGIESPNQANELNLLDTLGYYKQLMEQSPPQQQEQEVQLQRRNGSLFWALLTTTLNTVEGVPVLDGLLEDITERKQAEIALQQLTATLEMRIRDRTAQLEATNQALEEFTYSVSHDLRAPLRIIYGFAQLLLEDLGESLNSEHLGFLQRIIANANRLDALISDLLTYSRLRQTDISLEPVSLSQVLENVLAQLEPDIQARQAQIYVEKPLPVVRANRFILIQVLINVLANAIKFVADKIQPHVRIWANQRGKYIRLWIQDNGIGIDVKQQQQIFNPFTRLHSEEEYSGTGIGLAIARKGIERLGGKIGVESQSGHGSRFWIELPTVMESL